MQITVVPLPSGRLTARIILLVVFLVISSTRAFSSFTVCNQSDTKVYIALGYFDQGAWYSRGWWEAEAGECIELLPQLSNRYYYLYAYQAEGGLWSGQTPFCIAREDFTLKRDADCATSFFKVDTGHHEQWTHFLYRDSDRFYTEGTERCDLVSRLMPVAATYLERYANQFLAEKIAGKKTVDVAENASFQFAIFRNGPVRTHVTKAGRSDGELVIEVPIRIVNAKVQWWEESDGLRTWHSENIGDHSVAVRATWTIRHEHQSLQVPLSVHLDWDSQPFYYFLEQKVDISELATPLLHQPLAQMSRSWQSRFHSIFQNFCRGSCDWQEEAQRAVQALEAYDNSREKMRSNRSNKSLAGKGI